MSKYKLWPYTQQKNLYIFYIMTELLIKSCLKQTRWKKLAEIKYAILEPRVNKNFSVILFDHD